MSHVFRFTHRYPGYYVKTVELCWGLNSSLNKPTGILWSNKNINEQTKPKINTDRHTDFSENSIFKSVDNSSTKQSSYYSKSIFFVRIISANSPGPS